MGCYNHNTDGIWREILMIMKANDDHFSLIASHPEIVEHTRQLLFRFLLKFHNGVHSFLFHTDVIGRPSFQVIDVVLLAHLKHQVSLLPVHLLEDLIKGVFLLIRIMSVQLVHIESEVRQHLVIELVEFLVLLRVRTVDLSQDISEGYEHPSLIQHVPQLQQGLVSREEVQGLPNSDEIEFFLLIQTQNMTFLQQNGRMLRMSLHIFLDICTSDLQHLVTDIDALYFLEIITKTQQNLARADCQIQVSFSAGEGLYRMPTEFGWVSRPVFFIVEALCLVVPDVHSVQTIVCIITIGVQIRHQSHFRAKPLNGVKFISLREFCLGIGFSWPYLGFFNWVACNQCFTCFEKFWHICQLEKCKIMLQKGIGRKVRLNLHRVSKDNDFQYILRPSMNRSLQQLSIGLRAYILKEKEYLKIQKLTKNIKNIQICHLKDFSPQLTFLKKSHKSILVKSINQQQQLFFPSPTT